MHLCVTKVSLFWILFVLFSFKIAGSTLNKFTQSISNNRKYYINHGKPTLLSKTSEIGKGKVENLFKNKYKYTVRKRTIYPKQIKPLITQKRFTYKNLWTWKTKPTSNVLTHQKYKLTSNIKQHTHCNIKTQTPSIKKIHLEVTSIKPLHKATIKTHIHKDNSIKKETIHHKVEDISGSHKNSLTNTNKMLHPSFKINEHIEKSKSTMSTFKKEVGADKHSFTINVKQLNKHSTTEHNIHFITNKHHTIKKYNTAHQQNEQTTVKHNDIHTSHKSNDKHILHEVQEHMNNVHINNHNRPNLTDKIHEHDITGNKYKLSGEKHNDKNIHMNHSSPKLHQVNEKLKEMKMTVREHLHEKHDIKLENKICHKNINVNDHRDLKNDHISSHHMKMCCHHYYKYGHQHCHHRMKTSAEGSIEKTNHKDTQHKNVATEKDHAKTVQVITPKSEIAITKKIELPHSEKDKPKDSMEKKMNNFKTIPVMTSKIYLKPTHLTTQKQFHERTTYTNEKENILPQELDTDKFTIKGLSKYLMKEIYDKTFGRFFNKKIKNTNSNLMREPCRLCELHHHHYKNDYRKNSDDISIVSASINNNNVNPQHTEKFGDEFIETKYKKSVTSQSDNNNKHNIPDLLIPPRIINALLNEKKITPKSIVTPPQNYDTSNTVSTIKCNTKTSGETIQESALHNLHGTETHTSKISHSTTKVKYAHNTDETIVSTNNNMHLNNITTDKPISITKYAQNHQEPTHNMHSNYQQIKHPINIKERQYKNYIEVIHNHDRASVEVKHVKVPVNTTITIGELIKRMTTTSKTPTTGLHEYHTNNNPLIHKETEVQIMNKDSNHECTTEQQTTTYHSVYRSDHETLNSINNKERHNRNYIEVIFNSSRSSVEVKHLGNTIDTTTKFEELINGKHASQSSNTLWKQLHQHHINNKSNITRLSKEMEITNIISKDSNHEFTTKHHNIKEEQLIKHHNATEQIIIDNHFVPVTQHHKINYTDECTQTDYDHIDQHKTYDTTDLLHHGKNDNHIYVQPENHTIHDNILNNEHDAKHTNEHQNMNFTNDHTIMISNGHHIINGNHHNLNVSTTDLVYGEAKHINGSQHINGHIIIDNNENHRINNHHHNINENATIISVHDGVEHINQHRHINDSNEHAILNYNIHGHAQMDHHDKSNYTIDIIHNNAQHNNEHENVDHDEQKHNNGINGTNEHVITSNDEHGVTHVRNHNTNENTSHPVQIDVEGTSEHQNYSHNQEEGNHIHGHQNVNDTNDHIAINNSHDVDFTHINHHDRSDNITHTNGHLSHNVNITDGHIPDDRVINLHLHDSSVIKNTNCNLTGFVHDSNLDNVVEQNHTDKSTDLESTIDPTNVNDVSTIQPFTQNPTENVFTTNYDNDKLESTTMYNYGQSRPTFVNQYQSPTTDGYGFGQSPTTKSYGFEQSSMTNGYGYGQSPTTNSYGFGQSPTTNSYGFGQPSTTAVPLGQTTTGQYDKYIKRHHRRHHHHHHHHHHTTTTTVPTTTGYNAYSTTNNYYGMSTTGNYFRRTTNYNMFGRNTWGSTTEETTTEYSTTQQPTEKTSTTTEMSTTVQSTEVSKLLVNRSTELSNNTMVKSHDMVENSTVLIAVNKTSVMSGNKTETPVIAGNKSEKATMEFDTLKGNFTKEFKQHKHSKGKHRRNHTPSVRSETSRKHDRYKINTTRKTSHLLGKLCDSWILRKITNAFKKLIIFLYKYFILLPWNIVSGPLLRSNDDTVPEDEEVSQIERSISGELNF